MNDLGELLETARRARGLTQGELAELAGVLQPTLSRYEREHREPDADTLARIADVLGVTADFLMRGGRRYASLAGDTHMRRQASAKPAVWRQLEEQLNMLRLHVSHLFEDISIKAEQRVPTFDPIDTDPIAAARMVRMQWKMPIGPVRRLTQWMEGAGCVIVERDFGTSRVDGLSQWIDSHPVILLNLRAPTDRKRLTLAHELGHLCLHSNDATEEPEREANTFAAEFLMPGEVIRQQLRNLTIGRLLDLKREWQVSMQALIERAAQLGTITQQQRTTMYKAMSAKGWRTNEPVSDELVPERPMLTRSVGDALVAKGFTEREIAERAGYAARIIDHPFRPSRRIESDPGTTQRRSHLRLV